MIISKTKEGNDKPFVFDAVQDLGNLDYVKNGEIFKNAACVAVLVGSESDLGLLDDYETGTIAFTAGFTAMWQKGADGNWASMV